MGFVSKLIKNILYFPNYGNNVHEGKLLGEIIIFSTRIGQNSLFILS